MLQIWISKYFFPGISGEGGFSPISPWNVYLHIAWPLTFHSKHIACADVSELQNKFIQLIRLKMF